MTDDPEDLTPQNLSPRLVEDLSKPIGFIILQWGMIEHALVTQIEAVAHLNVVGPDVRRQGAFSDRLKTMRRLLENIPQLLPYKDTAKQLLDEVQSLQTLRDTIVHGALNSYIAGQGLLIFDRLQPTSEKDGHNISQVSVKTQALQQAVNASVALRSTMSILAADLMRNFGR